MRKLLALIAALGLSVAISAQTPPAGKKDHAFKGKVESLAGGTGAPFVTTDTAAAQKAMEIEAEILMKATRVDGVFTADPEIDPTATLFRQLSYKEVRDRNLRVMDPTAIAHCMEHDLPILVFNYRMDGNIERPVVGSVRHECPPSSCAIRGSEGLVPGAPVGRSARTHRQGAC
jgi:uridylate kinase